MTTDYEQAIGSKPALNANLPAVSVYGVTMSDSEILSAHSTMLLQLLTANMTFSLTRIKNGVLPMSKVNGALLVEFLHTHADLRNVFSRVRQRE